MTTTIELRVAARLPCTEAEGPHRRFALWVQGCSLRCPGCCNPDMFSPTAGEPLAIPHLAGEISAAKDRFGLEGVTILGGEPLEQPQAVTALLQELVPLDLGVIVFSGYHIDEARKLPGFGALWRYLDTLVDGRFDPTRPERGERARRFIGSANQELHHRTWRYAASELWRGRNHAEIQVAPDGTMSIHGFPHDTVPLLRVLRKAAMLDP